MLVARLNRRAALARGLGSVLIRLAMLPILLLASAAPAAADGELTVLQVGWDGTVVPGTWSPVRVQVTGGAAESRARVEVLIRNRYQPNPQASAVEYPVGAYGQEVALPAGSTKEIVIWVPADVGAGTMTGSVRLSAGGRTIAEQPVEFRTTRTGYWPLVGVLAESPAVARAVSGIELAYQGLPVPLSVAKLSAADLPPNAERLRALTGLVVQGNAATTLTGEQRGTLQEWVTGGGHLILLGGPDAGRAAMALPPGSLPIAFLGADASADLAPLGLWAEAPSPGSGPAARFQAASGSPVAGTAERPLAWRLNLGQGTVTLLAADVGLEPLASWAGAPGLLRKALEPALANAADDERSAQARTQARFNALRLQSAVDSLPADAFPDWQSVALILGLFALVVGPLLHFLLWRADRREWVWLAVPAAALAVSGGLYFLGIGRDGRDILLNAVGHLRIEADGGARYTLTAGFFAPTHGDLAVSVPGDTPVRAWTRANGYVPGVWAAGGGVPSEPPYHVVGGRDTRVEFTGNEWSMRSVIVERALGREVGSVVARLGLDGGLLRGTVRNDTPFTLEDAALFVGQSAVKLGTIAPGQTAPVVLEPGPAADAYKGSYPLSYRIFGQPIAPGAPGAGLVAPPGVASSGIVISGPGGGMLQIPQDAEIQRRVRLFDTVISQARYGPFGQSMPLTFVAFTRAAIDPDLPRAGNHPVYQLTLVEQPVRLELSPGPFTLPPGLMPPETGFQGARGFTSGGTAGGLQWFQIESTNVGFVFRPPLPPRARVEALTIATRQVGPAVSISASRGAPPPANPNYGPAEDGVFGIYNWQTAAWEPLRGGEEQARVAPGAPYVGPDGTVRVQVSTGADRLVRFVPPELTVDGVAE